MFPSSLLTFGSLALLTLGKPLSARAPHEARSAAPNGFALNGPAEESTVLTMRVALVQGNMAGLEKELYDVSTPANPRYGQHLTKDEVEAYVKPAPASTSAVQAWLSKNSLNATKISPAGDWMNIEVTVGKANELLDADFAEYTDSTTGKTAIRTLSYSLPEELVGHVDFFHPTVAFPVPKAKGSPIMVRPIALKKKTQRDKRQQVDSGCPSEVTPTCLQEAYGIPSTPATQSSNSIYVSGFDDEYALASDLELFFENFRTDLPLSYTFSNAAIDGGSNPQNAVAGDEASLDVQYTMGIASDVPTTFISVGEDTTDGAAGFLDLADYLLDMDTPPYVLSTSYSSDEVAFSVSIATNLCNAYMQLGARGTSLLFASGDDGVAGNSNQTCTTFLPTFPSTCPYVTSVGATTGFDPETAASFSAGGFSNYFARPSYQDDAVSSYVSALGSTNEGLFNASGRGFPDVSAEGVNVVIVANAGGWLVDGTSCSTPIFAGITALINDQLIAAGKSPLGFLNPLLYANPSALTDITIGNGNPGCDTNGFPVTTGWDAVTGLGSPIFSALLSAAGL